MLGGKDANSDEDKKSHKSNKRKAKRSSSNTDTAASLAMHQSATKSSKKDLLRELPKGFKPGEFDVVCSRGKWAMNAPGNVRYRSIIKDNLKKYSATATKQEKSAIVSEIVESIQALSPQGGFVRSVDGRWYTVTDHIAREKTGQSFRDLLHTQYRSSTKAKRRRQKERAGKEGQSKSAASRREPPTIQNNASAATGTPMPSESLSMGSMANLGSSTNHYLCLLVLLEDCQRLHFPLPFFNLTVFSNIPNHSLNDSMTRAQLTQNRPVPNTALHNGSFPNSDMMAMGMVPHQQQHQLQPPPFYGLNRLPFPMQSNHFGLHPQQQQRRGSGDLEPLPIQDGSMPATLLQQQQQQMLSSMHMFSQAHFPLHLQHQNQMHSHPFPLPELQRGLSGPLPLASDQDEQHPSPQTLRQQLEPIPFIEAADHVLLDIENENDDSKSDSFEGILRSGFAAESQSGAEPEGRRHNHDEQNHKQDD